MSVEPKYKLKDRVRENHGSYIYIIDDYYEDDEDIIYIVHSLTSDTMKELKETDLVFAGFKSF